MTFKANDPVLWFYMILGVIITAACSYEGEMGLAVLTALATLGMLGCAWAGDPDRRSSDESEA